MKTKELICQEIEEFKTKHGGDYPEYYIGITNDPERRLVEGCELMEHVGTGILDSGIFYLAKAETNPIAVKIEVEFQEKGMKEFNPESRGVKESIYVYCFKKAKREIIDSDKEKIRKMVRHELEKLFENDKYVFKHIKSSEDFKNEKE